PLPIMSGDPISSSPAIRSPAGSVKLKPADRPPPPNPPPPADWVGKNSLLSQPRVSVARARPRAAVIRIGRRRSMARSGGENGSPPPADRHGRRPHLG